MIRGARAVELVERLGRGDGPEWYSTAEAAELLETRAASVSKAIRERLLLAERLTRPWLHYRIHRKALLVFVRDERSMGNLSGRRGEYATIFEGELKSEIRKRFCCHGHDFSKPGTYALRRDGRRICLVCRGEGPRR